MNWAAVFQGDNTVCNVQCQSHMCLKGLKFVACEDYLSVSWCFEVWVYSLAFPLHLYTFFHLFYECDVSASFSPLPCGVNGWVTWICEPWKQSPCIFSKSWLSIVEAPAWMSPKPYITTKWLNKCKYTVDLFMYCACEISPHSETEQIRRASSSSSIIIGKNVWSVMYNITKRCSCLMFV